jgi:N-terminal domain of galactosyltransferase
MNSSNPAVAVIVPYRADETGVRTRNASAVLRALAATGMQIVLSEQTEAIDATLQLPAGVVRIHDRFSGAFNKSRAINSAVASTSTPILVLADADTLVRPGVIAACVKRVGSEDASSGIDGIRPFGFLAQCDQEMSQKIIDTGELPATQSDEDTLEESGRRDHEYIPVCGGIVVVRRSAFETAGGMDENFSGWGGEDDALSVALDRSGAVMRILTHETAFHLWHPRENRYAHSGYPTNSQRAQWWRTASESEFDAARVAGQQQLLNRAKDSRLS